VLRPSVRGAQEPGGRRQRGVRGGRQGAGIRGHRTVSPVPRAAHRIRIESESERCGRAPLTLQRETRSMPRRPRSILAAKLLSLSPPMLRTDRRPVPRLLEAGLAVKLDGENGEALRSRLDSTFESLGADGAAAMIDLHRIRPLLERTEYKYSLFGNKWPEDAGGATFRIASRLATGRGITFDVLVLRSGGSIAPHIHDGTVSGMLVVDGEVGFQTYDVVESSGSGAILKPGLAGKYGPGGVSTSSTLHHNLHWIHGFAPISYVPRF